MHLDGTENDAPGQIVIRLHWNAPCLCASVVKFFQAEVKDSCAHLDASAAIAAGGLQRF